MNRRRKWLTAVATSILVLFMAVVIGSKTSSRSDTENPGLSLRFVRFTNIDGRWFAQMVLTNRSGHLQFVHSWGDDPDYWGQAKAPNATYPLTADHFGVMEHN